MAAYSWQWQCNITCFLCVCTCNLLTVDIAICNRCLSTLEIEWLTWVVDPRVVVRVHHDEGSVCGWVVVGLCAVCRVVRLGWQVLSSCRKQILEITLIFLPSFWRWAGTRTKEIRREMRDHDMSRATLPTTRTSWVKQPPYYVYTPLHHHHLLNGQPHNDFIFGSIINQSKIFPSMLYAVHQDSDVVHK